NSIEMDVAIMAVMAAGAQMAAANPFLTHPELKRLLKDVDAALLLTDSGMEEKAQAVAAELGIPEVLVLGRGGLDIEPWTRDAGLDRPLEALPAADDLALLIFTGGSTG